jgi:hypothetical protein
MLVELLLCVTKLGRFNGSTGGICFGKEKEQDALAGEVGEGEFCAIVCFQVKAGCLIADLQSH